MLNQIKLLVILQKMYTECLLLNQRKSFALTLQVFKRKMCERAACFLQVLALNGKFVKEIVERWSINIELSV